MRGKETFGGGNRSQPRKERKVRGEESIIPRRSNSVRARKKRRAAAPDGPSSSTPRKEACGKSEFSGKGKKKVVWKEQHRPTHCG